MLSNTINNIKYKKNTSKKKIVRFRTRMIKSIQFNFLNLENYLKYGSTFEIILLIGYSLAQYCPRKLRINQRISIY